MLTERCGKIDCGLNGDCDICEDRPDCDASPYYGETDNDEGRYSFRREFFEYIEAFENDD